MEKKNPELISEIIGKINDSTNILVALSSDPSVDEMCSAIGLSLFLDKMGKRATAIYSGSTPNALEFLKPEETFEPTVDALQDFVIALSKDKADHLRYKLDGDFVKIYITPYREKISQSDLNYSYGDFNVDLVLALNVANGIDLDSALREHGRIMHDAVIVNITTGNPGKLGEIEWSDKEASSISEMIATLIYDMNSETKLGNDEATAFLTGIVAATNKFSNSKTTPSCMMAASKLMESGADQQLISKNITPDIESKLMGSAKNEPKEEKTEKKPSLKPEKELNDAPEEKIEEKLEEKDQTKLDISHDDATEEKTEEPQEESKQPEELIEQPAEQPEQPEQTEQPADDLLDDLKAAEMSLSNTGAETTPEAVKEPLKIDSAENELKNFVSESQERIIQPSAQDFAAPLETPENNKYGQMLEEALSSVETSPQMPMQAQGMPIVADNPAAMTAPSVPTNPEINGVPQMNYMPLPGEEVLPPPPAPPIDMSIEPQPMPTPNIMGPTTAPVSEPVVSPSAEPIAPAMPVTEPTPTSLGPQPAMQDQVYNAPAVDPGAFKIPGM
ncbi:hypothetical protein IKZ77_03440 [Candidatus Saccharibacteria bacterium]|nr:hypothetical protein [Candidatus Saccharibacteria bacterium]